MPTATLTLTSADIAGDPVNVSKTSTCYKAGTTTPLDETTGLNKIILTTTTNKELYIATAGGNDKNAKMYICNKSTTPSEYVTITINAQDIGKLYAGDWMFIPWDADTVAVGAGGSAIEIQAYEAEATIEYCLFHNGETRNTSDDS